MGPRQRAFHQRQGLVHLLAALAHEGGPLIQPRDCPACGRGGPFAPVETWRDPVAGGEYFLWSCAPCGVTFATPREAVGSAWYEKASPLRALEKKSPPSGDWRFRTFLAQGLAPGKILDVGCGDGGFLAVMQASGWTGVGFDYDARMNGPAKARGVEVHTSEFGAFCRSRAAGEFDAITLFDVLEHTPEPRELLASLKPLLKRGGHIALTMPNALRPLPFKREEHDYPPHHFTRWTPEAMRGFLEREGFEVVHQDAGRLPVGYLADHIYFYVVMPFLLSVAKGVLFGKAGESKTVSELYQGRTGGLADKSLRQALVNAIKAVLRVITWPAAALMWLWYRATRPMPGDCLYTLARRVPEAPI